MHYNLELGTWNQRLSLLCNNKVAGHHHLHAAVDFEGAGLGGGELERGLFARGGYAVYSEPAERNIASSASVAALGGEVDAHRHPLLDLDNIWSVRHRVAYDDHINCLHAFDYLG